jgi:ATP-dependent RNA helicase DeaD
VLIVPFQRRRRIEAMLRDARIQAEWIAPPSPAEINARDRERLLATLAESTAAAEPDDDDRALAERLMSELEPAAIAAALVRALRRDLPAPEDILASGARDPADSGPRAGFEEATWFRINAGRRHNADPRWLLPIICRYGHVGRAEIGAIRIAVTDSYFQVTQRATPGFIKALRRATVAPEEEGLVIEQAEPRDAAPVRPTARPKPKGKPSRILPGWDPAAPPKD